MLQVRDLVTGFTTDEARLRAVDGVSFDLHAGQTLAVVGKRVRQDHRRAVDPAPDQACLGADAIDGADLLALNATVRRAMRWRMQIIIQDPFASLNPHVSVGAIIAEGMMLHGIGRNARDRRERVGEVIELLEIVEGRCPTGR